MMERNFKAETDAILEASGGFYTFDDILAHIHSGKMQSFTDGVTWVVTQVNVFPRKKVLEIALLVGNMEGIDAIWPDVERFGRSIGADMFMATGRLGWLRAHPKGWKPVSINFVRV